MAIKIPQVREQGLPTTTGVQTPNADAFGAGVGKAIGGFGDQLGDIGLQLQEKENEAKARESDTYFTQKVGNLRLAYEQKLGRDAYEGNPDYERAVLDLRKEAEGMLDNDRQIEMVRPLFDNRQNSAILQGKSHSIKSLQDWQESTIQGQTDTNIQAAIAEFGTPGGDQAMANVMAGVEDMGFEKGWSDDEIAVEQQKAMSGVNKAVISSKVKSDPYEAMMLFEEQKASGDLSPSDAASIENSVTAHYSSFTVAQTARTIIDNYELPEDRIAAAKELDDPEDRARVMSQVREQIRFDKAMEDHAKREVDEQGWKSLIAKPHAKLSDIPPDASPSAQLSMRTYVENGNKVKHNELLENDLVTQAYKDPQKFLEVKLEDHRHELRAGTYDMLLKAQKEIRAGGELNPVKPPKVLEEAANFSEIVNQAYTLIDMGKRETPEKVAFAQGLRKGLEDLKKARGRDLTHEEQLQVQSREVYQYKTKLFHEGTGVGGYFRDETRLGNAEFKTSEGEVWPEDIVTQAVRTLEENKLPLSVENVQRALDKIEQKPKR